MKDTRGPRTEECVEDRAERLDRERVLEARREHQRRIARLELCLVSPEVRNRWA